VRSLNENWAQLGRQLLKEQRSRFTAIPPVSIPRDPWVNQYPTTLYVFTDSIPTYAQQTERHMQNMTLEAIANLETTGGQSIVAQGRQERNQTRLSTIGIPLDNNLPSSLDYDFEQTVALALNGTFQGALPGEGITNINTSDSTWLAPAWITNYDAAGNLIAPKSPFNYTTTPGVVVGTGDYVAGSTLSIVTAPGDTAVVGTYVVTGPYYSASTFDYTNLPGGGTNTDGTGTGTGTGVRNIPICDDDEPVTSTNVNLDLRTGQRVNVNTNTLNAVASTLSDALLNNTKAGPVIDNQIECGTVTDPNNNNVTPSVRVNRGIYASITPSYPGSFSYADPVLPTNLDSTFMSGSVLPSSATVDEAIATVIECNCDCWVT
jgi:hypothetical protein